MNSLIDIVLVIVPGLVAMLFLHSQSDASVWLSTIALYLSWLATYYSTLRELLSKPRFVIEPDVSRSPANVAQADISWFFRLKVRTDSETKLENCRGRLLSVWNKNGKDEGLDPLNLFWARQDDTKVEITPKTLLGKDDFEFLDVAQFLNLSRKLRLRASSENQVLPREGGRDFVETTSLLLKVGIFGDKARTKILWLTLDYVGRENLDENPYALILLTSQPPLTKSEANPELSQPRTRP